jgi:hypothetical protein
MLLSCPQNIRQNLGIKIENRCVENLAQFICLGVIVINQYLIQEEIKKRLNSGSACYHLVFVFSYKDTEIRLCKTVIFPVFV